MIIDTSNYVDTPIHKKYQLLVNDLKPNGIILKTDTWNEVETKYPIEADYYLEIDEERVVKAKNIGFNAYQGDIRALPFEDEVFDTLIDLSTIDHIKDYEIALNEYSRVLKKGGKAIIVAWFGDIKPVMEYYGMQYWFNQKEFESKLPFNIIGKTTDLMFKDDEDLILYYLEK